MQLLYKAPAIQTKRVAELLNIKRNTANALVNDFVKLGVLTELTGKKRYRIFLFKGYFEIFSRES
jgi:DNA-binding IclR family transcriptional regulator